MKTYFASLIICFLSIFSLSLPTTYATEINGVLQAPKAAAPPVIDGNMDEIWYNVTNTFMNIFVKDQRFNEPDDWFDLFTTYRVMWDENNFYLFVSVMDEEVDANGGNPWDDDSIELYFDGDNSKNDMSIGYDDNDRHWRWVYGEATGNPGTPNEEFAFMITDYGYNFELKLPQADLTFVLNSGHVFGWEIEVNDRDNETRESISKWWSGSDFSWNTPALFGEAQLSSRMIGQFLDIHKTSVAPNIDGSVDNVWLNIPEISLNTYMDEPTVFDFEEMLTWDDLKFTYRTMWNDNNFYLLVQVIDDRVDGDGGNPWENDGIEIYIDGDNSKNANPPGYDENDRQWRWVYGESTGNPGSGNEEFAFNKTESGYNFELRIPANDLTFPLEEEIVIGWDIQVDDRDNEYLNNRGKWWSSSDFSWNNPSLFGEAQLEGLLPGAPPAPKLISVEPDTAYKGQKLTLTITSQNTRFAEVNPASIAVGLYNPVPLSQRIWASKVTVANDTLLNATIAIPANARLGAWDVNVSQAQMGEISKLSAFTIVPSPVAYDPTPADSAVNVSVSATLSWKTGIGAVTHNVYFGTSPSPDFIGSQADSTFAPGTLDYQTAYYWRVDEVDNVGKIYTGNLWHFVTEPPSPEISIHPQDFLVELDEGQTNTKKLVITNYGAGPLHYQLRKTGSASTSITNLIQNSPSHRVQNVDEAILAVVLRGTGTSMYYVRSVWNRLNSNWSAFGDTPLQIDYESLNKPSVTYSDLRDSGADVLIISNNYSGSVLNEAECDAVAQYVNEGHGLYMSHATFNNYNDRSTSFQVKTLAPLVGLDPNLGYYLSSTNSQPVYFQDSTQTIRAGLPNPYLCSYNTDSVYPRPNANWRTALVDGKVVAISNNNRDALVAKDNRIYFSGWPEIDFNSINTQDNQFIYNVINYAAQEILPWIILDSKSGTVLPNDSAHINITFDASVVDQDTHTGFLVVQSNDPNTGAIEVPVTLKITDNIPPGTITTLTAEKIGSYFVELSWLSPGDNDSLGIAERFDLRFHAEALSEDNWNAASPVADSLLPNPGKFGSQCRLLVTGLLPQQTYYFGIKTLDEAGLVSPLSNIVTVITPAETDALIYLPFNETSGDVAANYHDDARFNGRLYGFINLSGQDVQINSGWTRFGYQGGALKFDGYDDYVYITDYENSQLQNTTELTIKAAIKLRDDLIPTGYFGFYDVITKLDSLTGYSLSFNRENGRLRFLIKFDGDFPSVYESRQEVWEGGKWYEIMVTYNQKVSKNNIKIYVDNNLDAVYDEKRFLTRTPLLIFISGVNYLFHGTIDEVQIHNKAVEPTSAAEITVTSPNGGEQYLVGTEMPITWDSYNLARLINIYLSRNNGASWEEIASGIENTSSFIWEVTHPISNQCLVRVSDEFGVAQDQSDSTFSIGLVAGVNAGAPVIPTQFGLEQNYPNPFNPETRIQYQLPGKSHVRLTIYNTKGSRIKTLIDGNKPAGYHSIIWDATNESGQKLPSGIYFYKIKAGQFGKTRSMVLLR